ncbi:flagellin [Luteimonas sp. A478]
MSVINTNTIALNAQRNLSTNSASLSTTIQRLSSGLRINSAKDDAAGLAISERFTTQIRGMNQAARNANDGISLAQTAEGALGEIGNNLQRIRELAVQSSNATNSASDRQALQKEVEQLTAEIGRVAQQTSFNDTNLLDGSFSGVAFQVGANAGQLITVDSIANANTDALGGTRLDSGTVAITAPGTSGDPITLSGISVNGVSIGDITVVAGATDADTQAAAATALTSTINARSAELGVIATAGSTASEIAFTSIKDGTTTFDISGGTAIVATPTADTFVGDVDISDFAGAQQAIAIMDKALGAVNDARADLGAIQNRFSSVVANLQTTSENLSASRSRIMDTDFAAETAELSRTQILQQAGTAMLAQANQIPQNVLSLLR